MTTSQQPQLHVKSYYARSVPDAIEHARREMGPDAMLLNSRPAPPEARHLGALEVVFGGYREAIAPPALTAPAQPPESDGMEDLRRQMDELRGLIARSGAHSPAPPVGQSALEEMLSEAGIAADLGAEIAECVLYRLSSRSVREISGSRKQSPEPEAVLRETLDELNKRFETTPEIGRIAALVGPPGVGKTTTLVKLAVTQGLARGKAVRLISADTQRIGASEQLRTYAGILGVPFQTVETTYALAQAVDSAPPASLVLIDTAGLGPALLHGIGSELAGFLSSRQDIDTHLVLTASMGLRDLDEARKRFEIFSPGKLLFTKIDETNSLGALYSATIRANKPLSFLCNGQLIPEDIEGASKERIIADLVRQLPVASRAAA